jgi:hypothetical protein
MSFKGQIHYATSCLFCFVLCVFFSIDSLGGLRELSSESRKPELPLSWLVPYPRYCELGSCIVGSICQASRQGDVQLLQVESTSLANRQIYWGICD